MRILALITALVLGAMLMATAVATATVGVAPAVSFKAGMDPVKLGEGTTVTLDFQIAESALAFVPLTEFNMQLPAGMGFATTTLGLSTCSDVALTAAGAGACPTDSVMGSGTALVEAPFGPQLVPESAPISIFMTRRTENHTTLLFFFDGRAPVIAPIVLRSLVLTPAGTIDSVLNTSIPSIPTAPDAGSVALLGLKSSIGPRHVTYYKRVHGKTVGYHPEGLNVPEHCPSGGFVFVASFRFQNGSSTSARSVVPCPRATRRHGGRH